MRAAYESRTANMSEKIFETTPVLISSGLGPGIGRLTTPLWEQADNIYFDTFAARSNKGQQALTWTALTFDQHPGTFDAATNTFDTAATGFAGIMQVPEIPNGLFQQRLLNGNRAVFCGTHNGLWMSPGDQNFIDVSKAGRYTAMIDGVGSRLATRWSAMQHGDWCIFTNGREPVQIYKPPGPTFIDLGGTAGLFNWCQLVAKLGPHYLYINTDNDPREVRWSADGNPEALDPYVYVNAGRLLLSELATAVIAAVPLGRGLAAYSRSNMQMLNYIGSWGAIGASTTALVGVGAVSKQSIVPVGSLNYGLQKSGIFKTDGVSVQLVSDPALGTWMERNVNWDQGSKIAGRYNPGTHKITWSFPMVGSTENNRTIVYDTEASTFSFETVDFVFQVGLIPDVFIDPLVARYNGVISYADKGNSFNGGSVNRILRTKPHDFGKRDKWKVLDMVQVEMTINSGPGPLLRIGQHFAPEDPTSAVEWRGPFVLQKDLAQYYVEAEGMMLEFELTSNGVNDDWELNGLKFFGILEDGSGI